MTEKDIYYKVKSVIRGDGEGSSYIGENDFVSLIKGGITINFHIKQQNLNIENVFRTVKRAQNIIKDKIGYSLNKIDIDIYDSMEEMRQDGRSRSKYASWIAGIYDGKIRVISGKNEEGPEALYIILTHEIFHLAVDGLSKGNCPYWLDEGLAVHISQELPAEYQEKLTKSVKKGTILPLETLENQLPPDTEDKIRQLAYAQCSSLVDYVIDVYGWDTIRFILSQCTRRPVRTLLAEKSLNYYLLEQAWKRWYQGKIA